MYMHTQAHSHIHTTHVHVYALRTYMLYTCMYTHLCTHMYMHVCASYVCITLVHVKYVLCFQILFVDITKHT